MKEKVGELLVLGFKGTRLPSWLRDFETEFGLGGVILFDYNCQTKQYENNVASPTQVRELCKEIRALPSQPLIFVDQEGGKVRRLKESKGFAPLPSAQEFATLTPEKQVALAGTSFRELRDLGFSYNLAPVIDVNYNPKNPDIGKIERAYSADAAEVARVARRLGTVAAGVGLGLCLKHYPGCGGAAVNSHLEVMDLSDTIRDEQLALFRELAPELPGEAILVSHGLVRQWDPDVPLSVSPPAISRLRHELPDVLLLSDDLQMEGLQKIFSTQEACRRGLRAGLDLLLIGNNLRPEEGCSAEIARALQALVETDPIARANFAAAKQRIADRKRRFS